MEQEKLNEIIASHGRWVQNEGGKRADLAGADLRGADLRGANLRGTNLHGADLAGANLPIGVYQIVGPGSCNRCITYDSVNNQIVCGCWNDGEKNRLDLFARRIEAIYGTEGKKPNSKYYAEYMSAINFFRAMKELNKKS